MVTHLASDEAGWLHGQVETELVGWEGGHSCDGEAAASPRCQGERCEAAQQQGPASTTTQPGQQEGRGRHQELHQ